VDIRYIAWSGYDLAGYRDVVSIDGPPSIDTSVQGNLSMSASSMKPSTKSRSSASKPSIRSRVRSSNKPNISKASELRPFPKPRS